MSDIDVSTAKDLFALLHEPVLDAEERLVRNASPELDDGAVLDLALTAAIAHLRYTLNVQTFEYLRWKVSIARETARASLAEARAARDARAAQRAQGPSRTFRDGVGTTWTVTESACRTSHDRHQRCLLFSSDAAVRRVKHIPDGWDQLTDSELAELSWSR